MTFSDINDTGLNWSEFKLWCLISENFENSGLFFKYLKMNASRVSRPCKDPVDIAWNIGL